MSSLDRHAQDDQGHDINQNVSDFPWHKVKFFEPLFSFEEMERRQAESTNNDVEEEEDNEGLARTLFFPFLLHAVTPPFPSLLWTTSFSIHWISSLLYLNYLETL